MSSLAPGSHAGPSSVLADGPVIPHKTLLAFMCAWHQGPTGTRERMRKALYVYRYNTVCIRPFLTAAGTPDVGAPPCLTAIPRAPTPTLFLLSRFHLQQHHPAPSPLPATAVVPRAACSLRPPTPSRLGEICTYHYIQDCRAPQQGIPYAHTLRQRSSRITVPGSYLLLMYATASFPRPQSATRQLALDAMDTAYGPCHARILLQVSSNKNGEGPG